VVKTDDETLRRTAGKISRDCIAPTGRARCACCWQKCDRTAHRAHATPFGGVTWLELRDIHKRDRAIFEVKPSLKRTR
jgi:hypothetical protein